MLPNYNITIIVMSGVLNLLRQTMEFRILVFKCIYSSGSPNLSSDFKVCMRSDQATHELSTNFTHNVYHEKQKCSSMYIRLVPKCVGDTHTLSPNAGESRGELN